MSAMLDRAAETDFHDLRWILSMPLSRAALVPFGVIHLRHECARHEALFRSCMTRPGQRTAMTQQLAGFRHYLAALEDIARLQADGVCLADRERWAFARAETVRQQIARAMGLTDTRAFHGARPDTHGFPYLPSAPALVGRGRRGPKGDPDGGGTPPEAA